MNAIRPPQESYLGHIKSDDDSQRRNGSLGHKLAKYESVTKKFGLLNNPRGAHVRVINGS